MPLYYYKAQLLIVQKCYKLWDTYFRVPRKKETIERTF